jgi:hypothetical protein
MSLASGYTAEAHVAGHTATAGIQTLANNGFCGLRSGETFLHIVSFQLYNGEIWMSYLLPASVLEVPLSFRPHPQYP